MDEPTDTPTKEEIEVRLPWHKPELHRLVVTLDSGFLGGSDGDESAQESAGG